MPAGENLPSLPPQQPGTGAPPSGAGPSQQGLSRILIIDDEPPNVRILERLLDRAGGFVHRSTNDPRTATGLLRDFGPDLVLLDLHMPEMDGFQVLAALQELTAPGDFLPVLILTADATSATKLRALRAGATDFLSKPLDHSEVLLRIRNHLHTRTLHAELASHNERLEEQVRARTAELRQALEEVQKMQGVLVQQERLSAFGTMAGGVAHDFNNALSIILGYSEILLAENEKLNPDDRESYVRTIITAAKDSASMISRLREFYRPSDARDTREHVDFGQLAREAMALTQPRWRRATGPRISVEVEAEPVPTVSGNAAELRELLTNLIFNAVDAMPDGGTITVSVGVHAAGQQVRVAVTDEGTGMSEETRARCLEPFFTTKGEHGTGLGLAMVYGIAQRHHATMHLDSELGRGTSFCFYFKTEAPKASTAPAGSVRHAHALRIVVVDDQPFIGEILEQYLAQDGHTVAAFTEPEEALARMQTESFDLLVTDQDMPGLNGDELAAAAKERDPNLRAILLTGYGKDDPHHPLHASIDLILGKPVSLEALRQAVGEVFVEPGETEADGEEVGS